MRRIALFVVVMILLVLGGGLTTQLTAHNNNSASIIPGLLKQTNDPDASVFQATPQQAAQFFILVGFVLFNVVGMALTIAVVMWLLNRGVVKAKTAQGQAAKQSDLVESS